MGKAQKLTGGALIAARLEEFGWTQHRLAETVDVHDGTVSRWISGACGLSGPMLLKVADALGVDASDLIETKRTGTDG